MTYVKKDGWTLQNASDNFRKYKEIVMATVKKKVQIGSSYKQGDYDDCSKAECVDTQVRIRGSSERQVYCDDCSKAGWVVDQEHII